MTAWLSSPLLFYGTLPLSLAAPLVLLWFTARDRRTGQTSHQQMREVWRSSFSDIEGLLRDLLKCGYDRAHLVVTFKESGYFLQYRKYIHAKGDFGIELGFPIAGWSRPFVPRLRAYCDANGIAYAEGAEVHGDPMTFIHVDFGRDTAAAFAMAKAIVAQVFRIPTESTYHSEWDGLNPHGEQVDDPQRKPSSNSEFWRRKNEESFASSGVYLTDVGWFLLTFLCGYTGLVGLSHALIWKSLWAATGQAPDWGSFRLALFDLAATARSFDLVCFGLIAIVLAIRLTPGGRRLRAADRRSDDNNLILPGWLRAIGRVVPQRLIVPAILAATIASWFV